MEELNNTVNLVKSLQSKISLMKIDIDSRPSTASRRTLTKKFTHMKTNTTLADEHISKLQSSLDKSKGEIDEFHKKSLYLEAYSRRENLKFEGIAEASQHNATSSQSEETKDVLVDFLENVLGRQEHRVPASTQVRQAKERQWRWRPYDYCTLPEIFGQGASIQTRAQT